MYYSIALHEKFRNVKIKTFFKRSIKTKRCVQAWNREHLLLFAHVSNALKLVIGSVQPGLIRLARDLNLFLCLCQCHYTSTSYIQSLMRLYEIFKPLPAAAQCVSMCLSSCVYAHLCILAQPWVCISTFWSLSLSARWGTDTGIHLHAPADRHDLSCGNDLLFQNLPSQLMKNPGKIRLIRAEREQECLLVRGVLALLWASSNFIPVFTLSFSFCHCLSTTLNQANLLIKIHFFSALNTL